MTCTRKGCHRETKDGYKQCDYHLKLQRERDRRRRDKMASSSLPMTPDEYEQQHAPYQMTRPTGINSPQARLWPCPKCGGHTKTPNARRTEAGYRRAKLCTGCGFEFETLETEAGEEYFYPMVKNKAKHHKMSRSYKSICNAFAQRDKVPADAIQTMKRVASKIGLRDARPAQYFSE